MATSRDSFRRHPRILELTDNSITMHIQTRDGKDDPREDPDTWTLAPN